MSYYFSYFIFQEFLKLFNENSDALLALPTEVKTILVISLVIMFGTSLVKKAWRFIKIVAIVAVIYVAAVYLGII